MHLCSEVESKIMIKVLRLVFSFHTPEKGVKHTTKLGTFTNISLRGKSQTKQACNKLALNLYKNCLESEKSKLSGYCIDDDSFDTLNVPYEKIKPIYFYAT